MKTILPLALSAFVFFTACNSDSKTAKDPEAQVKAVAAPVDPVAQKMQELSSLTPLGLDELSSWLPAQLNGIKRTNLSMNTDMGYAMAHGDYEKNNKTDIRVTVYDCAGKAGADMYQTAYLNKMKDQADTVSYTKTIEFMEGKAIEHHEQKNKVTTLTYMADSRMLVVISARNLEPESVRAMAKEIGKKS